MTQLWNTILKLKIWSDSQGQDLMEYALGAGFVALAAVAFSPALVRSTSTGHVACSTTFRATPPNTT